MKPPFPYYGGKMTIAEQIAAVLPAHDHYVEAYAGSLAVLLAKTPAKMETVNDLDRATPSTLTSATGTTSLIWSSPAASGCASLRGGPGSMAPTGWRFYLNPAGSSISFPRYMAGYVDRMPPAARRLMSVSLECRDAVTIVEDYGQHAGVLIYADPPYPYSTRAGGSHYRHELGTEKQHRELAEALHGAKSAVVLSGYHGRLYDELYDGWDRLEIAAFTGNGGNRKTGKRTEVLWSNRMLSRQLYLDDAEVTA